MKRVNQILASLLAIFCLYQPLFACAVCFDNGRARGAFIWTTALLTFVPLIMIGGGIYAFCKLTSEEPHLNEANKS